MEKDSVVPDTIDETPSAKLSIIYPGKNESFDFGSELTPTEVKDEPEVKWNADPNKLYTLSMVDPDAPSRAQPTYREINHWLVVNIKGSDIKTGEVITDYRGSGAPKGSGLHRYIFLVYEQSGEIHIETKPASDSREDRRNFSIRDFAKKYSLGNPIAGNYFQAQWDLYVDQRKK